MYRTCTGTTLLLVVIVLTCCAVQLYRSEEVLRAGEGGQIDSQGSGTGPPDAARLAPKLRGDVAAHHFLSPLEMTGRNHSRQTYSCTARQFDERAMPDFSKNLKIRSKFRSIWHEFQ